MVETVEVEGLAGIPPGLDLAVALDGIDLRRLPNDDVVDVLVAQHRQLAREQARSWAAIDEVLHRRRFTRPGVVDRRDRLDVDGSDEIRAALSWTRRAAEGESDKAHTVVCLLPLVHAALAEGLIDRGKALVFARHLPGLTAEQIARICRALLPVAGGLTNGQLDDRIRRMILEIDPTYYEGRYRKALRDRRVVHYLDRDGAAAISATGLPAEEAGGAMERVDALARAARRAGHPGTLDQIRADTLLALLDGSVHGLSRDHIITALIARYAGGADSDPDTTHSGDPGGAAGTGSTAPAEHSATGCGTNGMSTGNAASTASTDMAGGAGSSDVADAPGTAVGTSATSNRNGSGGGPGGVGDQSGATAGAGASGLAAAGARPDPSREAPDPGPPAPLRPGGDQRVGIEIRVPLTTLIGLTERAGEIPGLGPVPASTARRAVTRARRASWRWAVVDDAGRLLTEGLARRRPSRLSHDGPPGGVVELQIAEGDLLLLAADPGTCGRWAAVVADLAEQHRRYRSGERLAGFDAHPEERFPRAGLRRYVQIRDRTCSAPGCRAPARRSDLDHTTEHSTGGTTTHDDLGPACRHDHGLKTDGGWRVGQPEPGLFVWTSPLGRVYRVRPEPILPPAVEEVAREPETWFAEPAPDIDRSPAAEPRTPRAPPPPDPVALTDTPDEPPPF